MDGTLGAHFSWSGFHAVRKPKHTLVSSQEPLQRPGRLGSSPVGHHRAPRVRGRPRLRSSLTGGAMSVSSSECFPFRNPTAVCLKSRYGNRTGPRASPPFSRVSDGPQPYQGRPLSRARAALRGTGPTPFLGKLTGVGLPRHRRRRRSSARNLVDALIARGDRVTVIDNLSTGKRENLEGALERGAILHEADIRDAGAVAQIFTAVATGGRLPPRRPDRRPLLGRATRWATRESNVLGTIAVLEAARDVQSRRVVFSSTGGGLYGDADVFPTPEDAQIRPLAPYGQGKLAAEGYLGLYTRLHGVSTVVASLRQRLRAPPGRSRRGRRRRDLLRPARRRAAADCVRRRHPDARLGRGVDVVRANLLAAESDVIGPINIGHGPRDLGARPAGGAARGEPRTGRRSSPEFAPRAARGGAAQLPRRSRARANSGGTRSRVCSRVCGGSWPSCDLGPRTVKRPSL